MTHMTTAVATVETERIVKLLRLIFSTDKAGEIVAAVTAAKRVLAAGDRDTHFVAEVFERGASMPIEHHDEHDGDRVDDDDDRSALWFAWHRRHRLSAKEAAFVENIKARSAPLTARQRKWLFDIVDRLEAA
jgi:poly(3-hydroxyalkanoate) synthetase